MTYSPTPASARNAGLAAGQTVNISASNYTTVNNSNCLWYGLPVSNVGYIVANVSGTPDNAACSQTANLTSGTVSGNIATWTGTSNLRAFNGSTYANYPINIRLRVDFGMAPSVIGSYILIPVSAARTVKYYLEIKYTSAVPPLAAAPYNNNTTFYPAISLYDAAHGDPGYKICSGYTADYYTVPQPSITSVTASANSFCGTATTTLTANGTSGTLPAAVVTWYTGAGGTGNNLGTGTTKVVGPGTYYARVTNNTNTLCSAVEASITVTTETTAPVLTAPSNVTVTNSPVNGCNAAVLFDSPSATDACGPTAYVKPMSTSGLVCWLKADAGVVLDANGNVSQWRDVSGNGNHATQGNFSYRPTAVTNAINGQPVIRFTTSSYLTTATNFSSTNYTLITVSKMNSSPFRLISSASTNWLMGYHGGTMNDIYCMGWVYDSPTAANTLPHMYTVTGNGSVSTLYDYGVQIVSNGNGTAPPGQLQLNGYSGLNELSNGDIAEVILYNRVLTTAERQLVEGYLAWKYQIQVPWASRQAFQTFANGLGYAFQAADQSGNTSAAVNRTVTVSTYPGPTVAPPPAPGICAGSSTTLTAKGMAPSGQSLNCSGSNDFLNLPTNLPIGSNWTIESWFKYPLPSTGSWNTLIRGTAYHHIIVNNTTQELGTYVGGHQVVSGFKMSDLSSGWHHIAAVGSGGGTSFYIDGIYVGRTTSQPTDNLVAIGNYQGFGQQFGEIDEVRVWNTTLSQATLSSYMTREITSSHPNWANMVGYYKMDGNLTNSRSASYNGTVSVSPSYGTPAYYTYTWSGPGGSFSPNNTTTETTTLSNGINGSYSVYATANGCQSSTSNVTLTVNPIPTVPEVLGSTTTVTVNGCGSATFLATTGTNGTTCRFYNGIPPTAGGTGTQISGSPGSSLTLTGTQTTNVYVTSYNATTGCESQGGLGVGYMRVTVVITPTFTITKSQVNATCFGSTNGSATATIASGGTAPFTYTWSTLPSPTVNVVSSGPPYTSTLSGLAAGNYLLNITDGNGCIVNDNFTITNPSVLDATATLSSSTTGGFNIQCAGGTGGITVTPSGGTPGYTYAWSNGGTSNSISGVLAGNYSVTIKDVNLCQVVKTYTLIEPASLTITISPQYQCSSGGTYTSASLTANPSGGTPPYTYVWSNGGSTANPLTGLGNGQNRSVTVTDGNGCVASTSFTTAFPTSGSTETCNVIYVSADGDNSSSALATKDCPASFSQGLNMVTSTRNTILVKAGVYPVITSTLTIPSNVTIDGGYVVNVNNEWEKNSSSASIINIDPPLATGTISGQSIGYYMGMQAVSKTNFTIKDMTFHVKNGTNNSVNSGTATGVTNNRGNSVYGIYVSASTNYNFIRCAIYAGQGSSGNSGTTGGNGGDGGDGGVGLTDDCNDDDYLNGGGGGAGGAGYGGNGGAGGKGGDACGNGCGQNGNNGAAGGNAGGGGGSGGGQGSHGGSCGTGGNAGGGSDGGSYTRTTTNTNGTDYATAGSPASVVTASSLNLSLYLPAGQALQGGNGRCGGGGGGGGSTKGEDTGWACPYNNNNGNSGAGGGGGGGGGQGGTGGYGGGGSFGLYINAGSGGVVYDCSLNTAGGGAGGIGGEGGIGGWGGGSWTAQCGCSSDRSCAGGGGLGGNGAKGGRGQTGATGDAQGYVAVGSAGVTRTNTTVPNSATVTVNAVTGAVNSVITITKNTSAAWVLPAGAQFVDDLSSGVPSTNTSSNTAYIYFPNGTSTGFYDLGISGGTSYKSFIDLNVSSRTLPTINAITTPICPNTSITLGTSYNTATTTGYQWDVQLISSPNSTSSPTSPTATLFSSTSQNPGSYLLTTPGTYQVKLSVKEFCYGWSRPVYQTVVVSGPPAAAGTISGLSSACAGIVTTYSISAVAGANTYNWSVPSGMLLNSGQGTTGINVTLPVNGGSYTITVTPANTSCTPNLTGTPSTKTITVNGNPSAVANATNSVICAGTSTTLSGGGSGGSGSFTYAWSSSPTSRISGSSTIQNISTTNLSSSTTYTLVVTDGNSCTASATAPVTVDLVPTTAAAGPNVAVCNGTVATMAGNTPSVGAGTWSFVSSTPGGLSYNITSPSSPNTTITGLSLGTYVFRWSIANGVCSPSTSNVTVTVGTSSVYTWTGNVSTDWHQPGNWDCGTNIPDATIDVVIPTSPVGGRYPQVFSNGATLYSNGIGLAKTVTIQNGASVTVKGSARLNVN